MLNQYRLKSDHDLRSLTRMASGTDAKINVGRGHRQLREEHVRHVGVIVLPRMQQGLPNTATAFNARITGAAFIKFGLAPTTWRTCIGDFGNAVVILRENTVKVLGQRVRLKRRMPW